MGALLTHGPIEPGVVAIQVGRIYFDAPCRYCKQGRRATTNIRPVDYIGRPMANLNVCTPHADELVARARAKNIEISIWEKLDR